MRDRARCVVVTFGVVAASLTGGVARAGTPPVATITPPATLTTEVIVRFDTAVRSVTASNTILTSDGATVATHLRCLDASGAAADCLTGAVRTAVLAPTAPLVAGGSYVATVDPAGVLPQVVDTAGDPVAETPKAFRGSLVEQETSAGASFQWRKAAVPGKSGVYFFSDYLAGARATFAFTGRSVTWSTRTGPGQGLAAVSVDWVSKGTFNNYSATAREGVARTFGGLPTGRHVIAVRVLGRKGSSRATGTWVSINGFGVDGGAIATTGIRSAWQIVTASGASGGAFAHAAVAGPRVTFTFRGKGIDWQTTQGPSQGKAAISLDGIAKGVIDDYAPALRYNVRHSLIGLTDAIHTLTIVVLGQKRSASAGTFVSVDRWLVRLLTIAPYFRLGMWVDLWDYTWETPAAQIADMHAHHVRTVFLETARWTDSADITYPAGAGEFIERAHAAGMKIVGWYLPGYGDMTRDVRRTLAVVNFRSPSGQRFDGVAIDIEDRSEVGTRSAFNAGIGDHLSRVRRALGTYPVGAITPAPLGMALAPSHWEGFPWTAIGSYSDIVLPMAYWTYRTGCPTKPEQCPYGYARGNIDKARQYTGLPVHIIGGVGDKVKAVKEYSDFVQGTRDQHAYGGSFYDYNSAMNPPSPVPSSQWWPALEKLNLL